MGVISTNKLMSANQFYNLQGLWSFSLKWMIFVAFSWSRILSVSKQLREDKKMESMTAASMAVFSGPTPRFVNLDPKYLCIKCSKVLNQPRQLPCGHRICRPCVEQLLLGHATVTCPSGEEDCNATVTHDQVIINATVCECKVNDECKQTDCTFNIK